MVIEKNSSKIALIDTELHSPHSRDTVMSCEYDEDVQRRNLASVLESEQDDDTDFDDSDSGAGSDDDFDLLKLGESGEEFCQVRDQTCSVPYELYDLPGLENLLSLDVWNDVLTEDDRLNLSKYLPDMDQENYVHTLKQLFSGDNFLFGSPMRKLFEMLKGGMFEPRVALYRKGLNFFQKRQHYHNLRKYHNTMVNNLHQIRDVWMNFSRQSIDKKLHIWDVMKRQKNDDIEAFVNEPYDKDESGDAEWRNKLKNLNLGQHQIDMSSHSQKHTPEVPFKNGKRISKRNSKLDVLKIASVKEIDESIPSTLLGVPMRSHCYGSSATFMEDEKRDQNLRNVRARGEEDLDSFLGSSTSARVNPLVRDKRINKLSDITILTVRPSSGRSINGGKSIKHEEDVQQIFPRNQMKHSKSRKSNAFSKGRIALLEAENPAWLRQHGEFFPTKVPSKAKKITAKSKQWDNGDEFEDMESDHSEHMEEDEDVNSLMRSNCDGTGDKKFKLSKKDKRVNYSNLDGSAKMRYETPGAINLESRGTMLDARYFSILNTKESEEHHLTGLGNVVGADDQRQFYAMESNGYADAKKYSCNQRKRRKGTVTDDPYLPESSQMHKSFEDDGFVSHDNGAPSKLQKKNWVVGLSAGYHTETPDPGSNNLIKKWKPKHVLDPLDQEGNDCNPQATNESQFENKRSIKKRGKTKMNVHDNGVSQPLIIEMETEDIVESVPKRSRNPFPLITPTVPCNFSFSIIHLISAVRMSMVTLLPDDSDSAKHTTKNDTEQGVNEEQASKPDGTFASFDQNVDLSTPSVPVLSVHEIINRVKSNPGDPCILETQEPLQDLIRGVLKIFSSKTAPLGAKGWKPLVAYDKSKKSWLWTGPMSKNSSEYEASEEVTSPDAWGLPHKMLVKLVDSFANWLKNSQETLKQIGSLPSPPLASMQVNFDEKERFKDLKAQKSLTTINPSTEEVKAYFRKEEELRYQIPDRAFSYTAIDGKKSIVAPLKRFGGKPTSKARDHFMLKPDRPPHVTILCLVRDAACRLPGSTGTRADVCTLIRDSQYIVEEVPDTQVNQVVSGALDRLHYERDPCVQYESDRKLWVYLHRDREEEDFEDDGTSSTKKWKRQKKESNEALEPGDGIVNSVPDLVSDLNVEASFADDEKRPEPHDPQIVGNNAVHDE